MAVNLDDCLTGATKDTDTAAIGSRIGGHVRCIIGELQGVEGLMVATRNGGRVLVRVAEGFYFEVSRICVRRVNAPSQ